MVKHLLDSYRQSDQRVRSVKGTAKSLSGTLSAVLGSGTSNVMRTPKSTGRRPCSSTGSGGIR